METVYNISYREALHGHINFHYARNKYETYIGTVKMINNNQKITEMDFKFDDQELSSLIKLELWEKTIKKFQLMRDIK